MRICPGPTACVSATHHSSDSQDRSSLANRTLASAPRLHLGVLYSEGITHHTALPCQHSEGPWVYCRELGMGNVHLIQACGLWASRRKDTAAASQSQEHHRACQQARPANKSCATKACVCCQGEAAEGGALWGSSWAAAVCCRVLSL